MQKKVGIIGTIGKVSKTYQLSTQDLLQAVGMNTGNLVFQYAVYHSIHDERVILGLDLPWDVRQVKEACRIIVIPAANFVREGADFSSMANFLEQIDLPFVVVGLGAQATDYSKRVFDLMPGTKKLLSLFKERCKNIGVRGSYSAEILHSMGIDNTVVMGCPSNFINPDPNLPNILENNFYKISNNSIISATGDEPWPQDLMKRDAERKLLSFVKQQGGVYVIQSVEPFIKIMRSANSYQIATGNEFQILDSLRNALMPEVKVEDFKKFAYSGFRIYVDVDQWLEDASRFDFSMGLRLHGNMVPFQAGVPALWITHDARTQELAETMSLPRVSVESFLAAPDLQILKEKANPDFSVYGATRKTLMSRYLKILEENEIAHSYEVKTFDSNGLSIR